MHVQTHIFSGWCIGNIPSLTGRERLFCMLAASLQDLDGLGIVVSEEWYWATHHKLGHGVLALAVLVPILTFFSSRRNRIKAALLYAGLFHLHLVLDLFGSGPGWEIHYFWPFSQWGAKTHLAWPLFSWQNITAFVVLLGWTLAIAIFKRRTPLEVLMPSLDRKFVAWMDSRRKAKNLA